MTGLSQALIRLDWLEKLARLLARRRGARLGEATVVSRQVHMSDPRNPELVTILSGADAGQAFYGRRSPGEIIHLDIFHAVADVDHRRVAAALCRCAAGIEPGDGIGGSAGEGSVLDWFDLMTGTGGGRVTGSLQFGRRESLRVAHRNHVHLAGFLPEGKLHLALFICSAVEEELLAQGVELRRVERLRHTADAGFGIPLDLSHYTDCNDTQLRGPGSNQPSPGRGGGVQADGARGRGAEPGSEAGQQSLRAARGGVPGATGPAQAGQGGGEPGQIPSGEPTGWDSLHQEQRLQAALDLSRRLGSPDEVKRVLADLQGEHGWASLYSGSNSQAPFIMRQLEEDGLVRREARGVRLTEKGQQLARFLEQHLRDVKLRFRKLIRRVPGASQPGRWRAGNSAAQPSASVRYGPVRGAAPAEAGARLGDLAVPQTVRAALKRTFLEHTGTAPGGAPASCRLRLKREDLHVLLRTAEQSLHICLLIDASASMAGRRILAAKHLARNLLLSTRDRVAVISFQERDVRVHVPFTRDWSQVEEGLAGIQPMGLTPLAHGLTRSLELIRASRVRRPLLLLITDGIPTVPRWTIDPLADALEAARMVGAGRIPFGCIGLQPSRRYLEELVKAGGGTLHVVDELDEEALVAIAHRERQKRVGKAR